MFSRILKVVVSMIGFDELWGCFLIYESCFISDPCAVVQNRHCVNGEGSIVSFSFFNFSLEE